MSPWDTLSLVEIYEILNEYVDDDLRWLWAGWLHENYNNEWPELRFVIFGALVYRIKLHRGLI